MKKILYLIYSITLLFFGGVSHSGAQAPDNFKGFSITPLFQEINLEKDQANSSFFIDVINSTDAPEVLRISVLDFGTLDESGGVAFLGSSQDFKYSLASWVSLEKDAIVLNPGETQTVKGTIENKESLSPGGHYGAVFFKSEDKGISNEESSQVAFDPSFASLLFVRKTGGEIYELNLKSEETNANIFLLPSKVSLRFQNTGNLHVTPRGIVSLTDPLGREVKKGIINSDSGLILPETFRIYSTSLIKIATAYLPGKYNLSIGYRYDGNSDFIITQVKFFLIPPFFSLLIILAVLALAGYFYFRFKKKK